MGCDIHWYVERKNGQGIWELVGPSRVCVIKSVHEEYVEEGWRPKFDPEKWPGVIMVDSYDEQKKFCNAGFDSALYVHRNYDLFSVLADCGRGSFESLTGENRGIPGDVSNGYLWAATDGHGLDANGDPIVAVDRHSYNWCTLAELLAVDWDTPAQKTGQVGVVEFLRYKLHGAPAGWSNFVAGWNVKFLSEEEMSELAEVAPILSLLPDVEAADAAFRLLANQRGSFQGGDNYCKINWTIPYRAHCKRFIETTLPAMQELGDPENVRAVYFFDN